MAFSRLVAQWEKIFQSKLFPSQNDQDNICPLSQPLFKNELVPKSDLCYSEVTSLHVHDKMRFYKEYGIYDPIHK